MEDTPQIPSYPHIQTEDQPVRRLALAVVFIAGCSTAPIADLLDRFSPGKLEPAKVAPYGGVCGPQQVGVVPAGPVPVPGAAVPLGPPLPAPPGVAPQGAFGSPPLPPPDFGLPPGR